MTDPRPPLYIITRHVGSEHQGTRIVAQAYEAHLAGHEDQLITVLIPVGFFRVTG